MLVDTFTILACLTVLCVCSWFISVRADGVSRVYPVNNKRGTAFGVFRSDANENSPLDHAFVGSIHVIYDLYRLGAPRNNMTYPATHSTDNRNDNQPWIRIPRVKSLENSRLKFRSPLLIGITMTAAMYAIPTWPKHLYCVINQQQKAGRIQVFLYCFALCQTRCKISSTNLIGLVDPNCSCGGIGG